MKKIQLNNNNYKDLVIMPIIAKKIKLCKAITIDDKKQIYNIFRDYIDLCKEVDNCANSVIFKK